MTTLITTDHLFEAARRRPLLAAHRGVSAANIPCNTLAAYDIAARQGADIVELDVTCSRDGQLYVFHPGMEGPHLHADRRISEMTRDEVARLRFVNQDDCPTPFGVNTLEEAFGLLRGRCLINVDKYWEHMPRITECIRRCGMEKQVIVKTPPREEYFDMLARLAPDLAYMPVVRDEDTVTPSLVGRGIHCVGAEVLFDDDRAPVASPEYIRSMHDRGLLVWVNAIVYDSNAVISGHHTDDGAMTGDMDANWGWLIDRGFDIIQTDWLLALREYTGLRRG